MKALVVYGTRWGGTVAIAQKIGETLKQEGLEVTVADAKTPPETVDSYDLMVVGSGMRADKWTKETILFLEKNAPTLRHRKTALFVSCQIADRKDDDPIKEKAKKRYLTQTAQKFGLRPLAYGFFGGYMDFSQSHGLIVDIMMKVNRKKLRKGGLDQTKTLDTRNWTEIQTWTRQVANQANQ